MKLTIPSHQKNKLRILSIIMVILLSTSCKPQSQNSKFYGTWVAERHGLSDSITFQTNGVLTMYYGGDAITGEAIDDNGKKIKTTFVIYSTQNIFWIDIEHIDLKTKKVIETTKGIIKLMSDNKLMLRIPFDKDAERPVDFDYSNEIGETMVYTKRS